MIRGFRRMIGLAAAAVVVAGVSVASWGAEWPTARGSAARTGCIDNRPGPKAPKVLWVFSTEESFIASPALDGAHLFVSGLGAFNTSALHALPLGAAEAPKAAWSKATPFLKLPVVCSPAISGGRIVFGDGMHQTDGATLYCLDAATGRPLWQLAEPGDLVHLEGAPTIADGKVYIGGGAAGVLCVDLAKLTLDGEELTAEQVQQRIDARWKQLQEAYEKEKKVDPDFAIPPNEDQLPKAAPRTVWQSGKGKLHVDSPVAVAEGRVLVGSAYLDTENVGDRALLCFDAASGETKWRVDLAQNPWAGPTVSGSTVLVGCSSIRFDPKEIPQARGEVVAVSLADGKPVWKKTLPAGVVSSVAAANGMAIFTATDGKVRAAGLADGQDKWSYDAGAPFFAAPAVAGGVVYAADLKGVLHAVAVDSGKGLWKLDLGKAAKAGGMAYGAPVVHGGRVYVATCNVEGTGQQPTGVVCIGE